MMDVEALRRIIASVYVWFSAMYPESLRRKFGPRLLKMHNIAFQNSALSLVKHAGIDGSLTNSPRSLDTSVSSSKRRSVIAILKMTPNINDRAPL